MAALRDFLKPDLEQAPRPDPQTNPDGIRYTRTFLWMRLGVGVLGVLLPVTLIALDSLVFNGHPFVRGSMSAYYYSGMREFFVGSIFGSGAFLLAYKVSEVSLDNTASIAAGICAWFIAICPTGPPSLAEHPKPPPPPLNPLQDLIGEGWVKGIHYGASGGFIICLAVVAVLFGVREGKLPPVPREAPAAVLAHLPLHVCRCHGPWRGLDPRDVAHPQRSTLVDPPGRMGLHLGLGALLARRRAQSGTRSSVGRFQVAEPTERSRVGPCSRSSSSRSSRSRSS